MPRAALLLALLALFGAGLAACGDADETGGSSPAEEQTSEPAGGAPAIVIDMKGNAFAPAEAKAKVGDTVTWTNSDPVVHNVTGGGVDSGSIDGGADFTFTPEKSGRINYVCTIHPGMKGSLTVDEA